MEGSEKKAEKQKKKAEKEKKKPSFKRIMLRVNISSVHFSLVNHFVFQKHFGCCSLVELTFSSGWKMTCISFIGKWFIFVHEA